MKNKLFKTLAAGTAAVTLLVSAAYAEGAYVDTRKLPPGTNFDSMVKAHAEASTAELSDGETTLIKTADENGKITFYLSSVSSDMVFIDLSLDSTGESVASVYVKPRTFAEYSFENLTPGGSYSLSIKSSAQGRALVY